MQFNTILEQFLFLEWSSIEGKGVKLLEIAISLSVFNLYGCFWALNTSKSPKLYIKITSFAIFCEQMNKTFKYNEKNANSLKKDEILHLCQALTRSFFTQYKFFWALGTSTLAELYEKSITINKKLY